MSANRLSSSQTHNQGTGSLFPAEKDLTASQTRVVTDQPTWFRASDPTVPTDPPLGAAVVPPPTMGASAINSFGGTHLRTLLRAAVIARGRRQLQYDGALTQVFTRPVRCVHFFQCTVLALFSDNESPKW